MRFSSLQYVKLKPIEREKQGDTEVLTVEIDNYVLLSPDALNLDEANAEVAKGRQQRPNGADRVLER